MMPSTSSFLKVLSCPFQTKSVPVLTGVFILPTILSLGLELREDQDRDVIIPMALAIGLGN